MYYALYSQENADSWRSYYSERERERKSNLDSDNRYVNTIDWAETSRMEK